MTNDRLTAFHAWLNKELPAREDEIEFRLDVLHRMLPAGFQGWPKGSLAVSRAMRELESRGLARKEGADWFWVAEPVKAEPQGVLFA